MSSHPGELMSFLNLQDITQDTEGKEELDAKRLFQGCFKMVPCE